MLVVLEVKLSIDHVLRAKINHQFIFAYNHIALRHLPAIISLFFTSQLTPNEEKT